MGGDAKTADRSAALKVRGVDREAEREMGENLLDFARQPTPARRNRSDAGELDIWTFVRPRRARQLDRRGEKTLSRSAANEKGPVGTAGEEHRPLPAWSRLRLGAPRKGLGDPGAERRATLGERAQCRTRECGAANGRPDIHERLGEIARPFVWRKSARRGSKPARTLVIGFSRARSRARTRAIFASTGAVWRPKAIAATAAAV